MRKINGSIIALNRKAFLLLSVMLSLAVFGVVAWRINAQRAVMGGKSTASSRQDTSNLKQFHLDRRLLDDEMERRAAPTVQAGVAEVYRPDETQGNPVVFAYNSEGNRLISFNANTPDTVIADVGVTGLNFDVGDEVLSGIDFRASNGQLYGIASFIFPGTSRVVTINTTTGAATFVKCRDDIFHHS